VFGVLRALPPGTWNPYALLAEPDKAEPPEQVESEHKPDSGGKAAQAPPNEACASAGRGRGDRILYPCKSEEPA